MAKHFAINTEPHEVTIGDTAVYFVPEANGAGFLQAYAELSATQKLHEKADDEIRAATEILDAMNAFTIRFLEPDSVPVFRSLNLPSRVVIQLVEHMAELYGGGSEERPTGPSNGSAKRSGNPGKRG